MSAQSLSALVVMSFVMPLALLSRFDAFVDADFIGNRSSACSDRSADQRALASAQQGTGNCSSCCGATYNLCPGVVTMIMRCLRVLCAFMTLGLCLLRKA